MMKQTRIYMVLALLAVLVLSAVMSINAQEETQDEGPTEFHLRGTGVQEIGQYPDTMAYDGSGVMNLEAPGFFEIHLDAANNVGLMFARFTVESYQLNADTLLEDAQITVIYPLFGAPTGVMPDYWEGGIATDALLHGDSGHEAPILPTVYNDVASWGPALVFVDGEQLMGAEEIMGAPNVMGAFAGHMMYSNEVRDPETGFVGNEDSSDPYSPMEPANGVPYAEDATLLHLIVRTEESDTDAFPPFSMFMHFNFLDVEEIDPLEGVDYLSFDMVRQMMQDMEPEALQGQMEMVKGQWLALVDEVESSLQSADES